jgi:hypothetical protein
MQGLLEVILRGLRDALALVRLRNRIRAAAHLPNTKGSESRPDGIDSPEVVLHRYGRGGELR